MGIIPLKLMNIVIIDCMIIKIIRGAFFPGGNFFHKKPQIRVKSVIPVPMLNVKKTPPQAAVFIFNNEGRIWLFGTDRYPLLMISEILLCKAMFEI